MEKLYTYAVSRVKAKESALLTNRDLERLLSAASFLEAVSYLKDRGIGSDEANDLSEILEAENKKLFEFIKELKIDKKQLEVFLLKKDFENLKTAIKAAVTGAKDDRLYAFGGLYDADKIKEAVKKGELLNLPEIMRVAAKEATEVLLKTGDGQKCDIICDRAALCAIRDAAKQSGDRFICDYAEAEVALSDIKIAVRGAKIGSDAELIKSAMAECETLNLSLLSSAAISGGEALLEYLSSTPYKKVGEALSISMPEFEKQCDNYKMKIVSAQRSNPFTIAPIAAYILAREAELFAVSLILSAKANGIDEKFIKERLRELYV